MRDLGLIGWNFFWRGENMINITDQTIEMALPGLKYVLQEFPDLPFQVISQLQEAKEQDQKPE